MRIMDFDITIPEIEDRLKAAGIPLAKFWQDIGIHRTTWQRWKAGRYAPRIDAWRQIIAILPPEAPKKPKRKRAA